MNIRSRVTFVGNILDMESPRAVLQQAQQPLGWELEHPVLLWQCDEHWRHWCLPSVELRCPILPTSVNQGTTIESNNSNNCQIIANRISITWRYLTIIWQLFDPLFEPWYPLFYPLLNHHLSHHPSFDSSFGSYMIHHLIYHLIHKIELKCFEHWLFWKFKSRLDWFSNTWIDYYLIWWNRDSNRPT